MATMNVMLEEPHKREQKKAGMHQTAGRKDR